MGLALFDFINEIISAQKIFMGPECDPPHNVFSNPSFFYASSHKPVEKNIGFFFFSEYYYTML